MIDTVLGSGITVMGQISLYPREVHVRGREKGDKQTSKQIDDLTSER